MAKKGLEYVCTADLQANGTYANGVYLGPSTKLTVTPTTNTVKDFGDNRVVESDTSVTTGTISLEINELTNKHHADLLGHKYDAEKDTVTNNADDKAPYKGIACIGESTGEKPYKAVAYLKVQFKEPTNENSSKAEQLAYGHTTLEGDFYTLENGDYSIKAGFDTRDEAILFINELFGIAAVPVQPETPTEPTT